MSKVSKQTKNRSCKSNVNKKCECEKVRKCEYEHEKNREQEQNERHECEHKERNSSINISDDDKKLKNHQFFSFTQLTSSVYSANSQYIMISKFHTILQIT